MFLTYLTTFYRKINQRREADRPKLIEKDFTQSSPTLLDSSPILAK